MTSVVNVEQLNQKLEDGNISAKKLTPLERFALLKAEIKRNLKIVKPIACDYQDISSKQQIEDHLSQLKEDESPNLMQLKELKVLVRDTDRIVKNPSKMDSKSLIP